MKKKRKKKKIKTKYFNGNKKPQLCSELKKKRLDNGAEELLKKIKKFLKLNRASTRKTLA